MPFRMPAYQRTNPHVSMPIPAENINAPMWRSMEGIGHGIGNAFSAYQGEKQKQDEQRAFATQMEEALNPTGATLPPGRRMSRLPPNLQALLAQLSEKRRMEQKGDESRQALSSMLTPPAGMQSEDVGKLPSGIQELLFKNQHIPQPNKPTGNIQEYEYSKQDPAFKDYLLENKKAGRTKVNVGRSTIGTIPPGYEMFVGPDGKRYMRPMPGSPDDQKAENEKRRESLRGAEKKKYSDIVTEDVDRALDIAKSSSLPSSGFLGNIASKIPGTPQHDVFKLVEGIRANVGFDRLQEMRNNSKTGGALGQVSDIENKLLQSTLGSLEQSQTEEQFIENLKRVKQVYLMIVHGADAAASMSREAVSLDEYLDRQEAR